MFASPSLTRPQFDKAFVPLRPALVRYAARLSSQQEAEDLTQQCYCTAVQSLERYNADTGQAGLLRWLTGILRNLCLEFNREYFYHCDREHLLPFDEIEYAVNVRRDTSDTIDLDAWLDNERIWRRIQGQVRHLKLSERRRLIWQRWSEGATRKEIAQEVGINPSSVCKHLVEVFTALRAARPDLIGRNDGYRSAEELFADCARVTLYRRPTRRGNAMKRPTRRVKVKHIGS